MFVWHRNTVLRVQGNAGNCYNLIFNCFVVVAWLVESVWRLAVDMTNNISCRDIII